MHSVELANPSQRLHPADALYPEAETGLPAILRTLGHRAPRETPKMGDQRGDVAALVAADRQIPARLRALYRRRVIGQALQVGALRQVPASWITDAVRRRIHGITTGQPVELARTDTAPEAKVAVRAIARALATAQAPGSGLASQQAAHATIVARLRGLGLDAGTARVLADRSQAAEFHPGQALSPALDRAHARAATTRAAYLVGAAQRLTQREGLARLDQQATERRYLNRHVEAQQAREQAAQRVDGAASMYGNVLGWYARLDDRTTPKCRYHHGANFRADAPPALGLPGETHGGNCRCVPGPRWPRGPRLTPAPADAPAEEVAMSRGITLTDEQARERLRASMDYVYRKYGAIELANKKLADGNEITESGLHYNPKTKTFRPATQAEKDAAGKKGGDFNSKHPRAAAGSPEGGQFVPLGTARDDKAAAAQKDKGATDAYQSIGSAMVANAKTGRGKIRALSDDALGKLTRVAYSSKTRDPKVVALRMALAAELRSRGKNVTDFGAQGGNAAPKRAAPRRQPSTAGLTKSRGAVVLDGKVSDAKAAELKAAGWKGRPGDKREALYPPPGVSLSRTDGIELATSSASLDASPRKNWVENSGGLPKGIRKVARALKERYPAWPLSRCIAVAISRSKVWAAEGSAKGARNTAEWTALKARNAARTATTLARTAEPTGDIEMAASPAFGGKTPTRNDVKGMVASDSKVPTKLKPKFRQRVMAHARNCKSEDCIPNHWRGGNPDKPGQTASATASTPPGKKVPFGGKRAAPFGAKKS